VVDNLHRDGRPALRIGTGSVPGRPSIEHVLIRTSSSSQKFELFQGFF
jgi:hypothetical protein